MPWCKILKFNRLLANWFLQKSASPDREILTDHTNMTIYNGFRARDIIFDNLPANDTIACGYELKVNANPIPASLAESSRISYDWSWQYVSPSGTGDAIFNPNNSQSKRSAFKANKPGDYEICYKIKDNNTGDNDISQIKLIHVKPVLKIIAPVPPNDTTTFGSNTPGMLSINFEADPISPQLDGDIEWTMDPIGSSLLTTPLADRKGRSVTFTYQNLPTDNSGFGVKKIIASLPAYNVADTVEIKVFFPRSAINNTSADPNWYYYWKQTNANIDTNVFGGTYCTPTTYGYFQKYGYTQADSFFHICDHANETSIIPPYNEGIDTFGETCMHENTHFSCWWAWWGSGSYNPATDDPDGDYIPTQIETSPQFQQQGYDPNNPQSVLPPLSDWEALALSVQKGWVPSSADSEDWANPGHQY